MASQDDFQEIPAHKQGMSSTAKVLLILGSIAGVVLLACCGFGFYIFFHVQEFAKDFAKNMNISATQNPAEVRERTQDMLHIDIPDDFKPVQAMEFMIMKWAVYQGKSGPQSMLIIMEMGQQMIEQGRNRDAKQQRDEMVQQLRQQPQVGTMEEIEEESRETRTFTIGGKPVEFDFIKGKTRGSQAVVHRVVGVIPTETGIVLVMLTVPEADYNEEQVTRMLESIRPADEESEETASPEAGPSGEMPADQNRPDQPDADADDQADSSQ